MATRRGIYEADTLPPAPPPQHQPPALSGPQKAGLSARLAVIVGLGVWLGLKDPCPPCDCSAPASTTVAPGNTQPAEGAAGGG